MNFSISPWLSAIFGIITLSAGCFNDNAHHSDVPENISGYYALQDTTIIGYTGIRLYSTRTYKYEAGMCVGSSIDSGRFSMSGDTLILQSVWENKVDTSNHGFDQVTPLTGKKYLLRGENIFFWMENGKYDSTAVWTKQSSI